MENVNCEFCNACHSCRSCVSCDYCNYSNYCYSCYACKSCDFCDYCAYCDYCYSCYSCYACNSCDYCTYCAYCDYCTYCKSCINLSHTQYNYFCYADDRDKDGYKRPPYQVFNTQVTQEEYEKIEKLEIKLDFGYKNYKEAFSEAWAKLSDEDKKKITSLPGFNKDIFKKYWGVEV
tara:strand:+ start:96 stop:623 length:528 start_codon:yes stop_codon:yes gene_type:complete